MMNESRAGVLLLSVLPEGHTPLLEALRQRAIPVEVARSGRHAVRKLRSHPVLVLVDLVHGPALDSASVQRVNASRKAGTVLGLHDGDLGRFADELDALVVDGFCRAGEWAPIVELASESFNVVAAAPLN
ncbi:MAG TPA: hypothetical protein VL123_05525 [Candidatus Udaeobacter sp.]|jgi:hypothetical protein|nr:hypothetical protein [Candidatus Udaeobacter sp.]